MAFLTSIEGFCGAGGMALGLKQAGFKSLLAFDKDPAAIESYYKNIGPEGTLLDARTLKGPLLLKKLGLKKGDRVGLWAPNCYEWVLTQFATAIIGVIQVFICF